MNDEARHLFLLLPLAPVLGTNLPDQNQTALPHRAPIRGQGLAVAIQMNRHEKAGTSGKSP